MAPKGFCGSPASTPPSAADRAVTLPSPPSGLTAPPFSVVTFNLRNGLSYDGCHSWPRRRAAAVATLRRLDADIVGLQECYGFQLRHLQRRAPGYRSVGAGRRGGGRGERCPLLARTERFELIENHTMWYGDEPDRPTRLPEASAPRIATVARYRDRHNGRLLRVACTHLDEHHAANRARSATQLADRLCGDEATVVLGDLNTGSEPAVFDALAAVGLRPVAKPGSQHTVHGYRPGQTGAHLDHILVSPGLHVGEVAVDDTLHGRQRFVDRLRADRYASDHWPVRAVLRWPTATAHHDHAGS